MKKPKTRIELANELFISNKKWFRNYAIIRTVTIIIVISLFVFSNLLTSQFNSGFLYLGMITLPLLFVILAFDFLQKPSFLEIEKFESGLILRQYKPDVRFLFFYQDSRVNLKVLKKEDDLRYKLISGLFPLFNQIELYIYSSGNLQEKSEKINIAWMSSKQNQILKKYFVEIN